MISHSFIEPSEPAARTEGPNLQIVKILPECPVKVILYEAKYFYFSPDIPHNFIFQSWDAVRK